MATVSGGSTSVVGGASLPDGDEDGAILVWNNSTHAWEVGIDKDPRGNSFAAQEGLSGASVTAGALSASASGNTAQVEPDGTVTLNAIETNLLRLGRTILAPATDVLSAEECTNTIINNYGQSEAATLTLPAAAADLAFMVVIGGTGFALHVKAGVSDKIYLDGTALDDADKVSLTTPTLGNCAAFYTFQTGASAYDWYCNTISGLWVDGGA